MALQLWKEMMFSGRFLAEDSIVGEFLPNQNGTKWIWLLVPLIYTLFYFFPLWYISLTPFVSHRGAGYLSSFVGGIISLSPFAAFFGNKNCRSWCFINSTRLWL